MDNVWLIDAESSGNGLQFTNFGARLDAYGI